jgi:hypothetical protein
LITGVLLFHLVAIVAAALAAPPSSVLERGIADLFSPYYDLIDQGYAYRYFAPEPPPTPIVTATLHFADGRPDARVRLPERGLWPRLRYQRQLALAHHLSEDFEAAKRESGEGSRSRWAHAYARHLCRTRPGCARVTLFVQLHLIPELPSGGATRGARLDLDAGEFYTAPERIGEFACDEF